VEGVVAINNFAGSCACATSPASTVILRLIIAVGVLVRRVLRVCSAVCECCLFVLLCHRKRRPLARKLPCYATKSSCNSRQLEADVALGLGSVSTMRPCIVWCLMQMEWLVVSSRLAMASMGC
jgi:hypothetical protein